MKRLVSLTLVVILALTAFACDKKQDKLATPTGVTATATGLISWNAVENATGYKVSINGQYYTTETPSYQVQSVINDFTYSVIATADGYKDSDPTETYTFKGQGNPNANPPASEVKISIGGPDEIKSGGTAKLTANVTGIFDVSVTWSVTKGSEYVSVDNKGNLTAVEVDGDKTVEVEVRSKKVTDAYATKTLTVVAKSVLTQDMLDVLDSTHIAFTGNVNIDLYNDSSLASSSAPEQTYTSVITTSMDGTNWYAEYENATIGMMTPLYYKKVNGKPCQVGVNFMNEEEYFPMTDSFGRELSWDEAGLYNSLAGLKVSDFTFDTESWRYVYTGSDSTLISRVISSANPYDFVTDNLALIIEKGEIMGIYSKSQPDYTIAIGYKAIQHLTVSFICGEEAVTVPTIQKYSHEDIHDDLNEAVANMQALTSYNVEFLDLNMNFTGSGYTESGFSETITQDVVRFRPFNVKYGVSGSEFEYVENGDYGYKATGENSYNAYYNNGNGTYTASRAYEGNMSSTKPTFAFAGEIFRSFAENEDGSVTYYVDEPMSSVASTFFYGVGNDINLYGIFAARAVYDNTSFTPFVTVKDGYITEACFYYNIGGLMYGVIEIVYSDFNSASLDADEIPVFETREVPTSWSQLTVIESGEGTSTDEDVEVNALEYFKAMFGDNDIEEKMPFFGAVLGDAYGFGLTTYYLVSNTLVPAVVLYYDVPLDTDYTITTSLNAVYDYLKAQEFTQINSNTFVKGNIAVVPTDENLDFMIYVYKYTAQN